MEIVDQLKLFRAGAVLQQEIQKHGRSPEMGLDFRYFRKVVKKLEDRELSDQFNLRFVTLRQPEAFWIICRDDEGEVIAVVAAKLEDLGPQSAPDFWRDQHARVYREKADGKVKLARIQSRATNSLNGLLMYMGDGWVRKDKRKTGLGAAIVQLAMLTGFSWWEFKTAYAFVHNAGMIKGLGGAFGFCHQHPLAVDWKSNPPQMLPDNWLVYNHRPDILDLIDRLSRVPGSGYTRLRGT